VSRKDQKLEPQHDALPVDGCEWVFEEKTSSRGLKGRRYGRPSTTVARLDRLGRAAYAHQ